MKFDKLTNRSNERSAGVPPHIAAKRCTKIVLSAFEATKRAVEQVNNLIDKVGLDTVLMELTKDEADQLVDAIDALAKFSNDNKSALEPELETKVKKEDVRRVHP